METVVIKVSRGVAEVAYQSENVDITIIDVDSGDQYIYKNCICEVSNINDDGTLNLKCVDTLDGSRNNKNLMNIPAGDISFYASGDDIDDLLEEDE